MKRAFIVGHPVAHSRSPVIHGHWLRELGIAGTYERIDVPPQDLPAFITSFPAKGFVGGNVTIPHKEEAFRLVADATPRARRLGAVNLLLARSEGGVEGDNTDGIGFIGSVAEAIGPGWDRQVSRALVIGAGGAARAIVGALLDIGIPLVEVSNRTERRTADLVAFDPERVRAVAWPDLGTALGRADLLINTTSLGMAGQPPLDLDVASLPDAAIVADAVYVPLETPLLHRARERGLRTVGGLGMLLHQAVPSFASWFGATPRVSPELRALIEADVERST